MPVSELYFSIYVPNSKVPAFLGSSFAFLGGFATIANMDSGVFADMSNADKLSYACGGIVVAGLLYLILALIIKLVGVKKVMRFSSAGRNRSDHHLHRVESCRFRHQ